MWLQILKPILYATFPEVLRFILVVASRHKSYKVLPDETPEEHKDRLRRLAINLIKEQYPNMRTSHIDILLGFVVAAVMK
jgi:hypothetical protein